MVSEGASTTLRDNESECAQQRNLEGVVGVQIMGHKVQLQTRICGLDWLDNEISWEFQLIGGEPDEQQFVVGNIVDHGHSLIYNGWLGQLKGFFVLYEIRLIEMASCDGLYIGKLQSSLDHDVAYPRLEGFAQVVFDPGG